tara:strand:+ start:179 stop:607 length:429 start_codon:yes stop_codon:yes gene_type:complete
MDFLTILLIILIILLVSNCKKGGLFSNEWDLKSEKERKKEQADANKNAQELAILAEEKNKLNKNNFLDPDNEYNLNSCNKRILGPVNEFHQKFKPLGKEYGFRHWWKKHKTRNYVPKDYNFDGTSVRQYLDNLDNVNNVYCH